MRTGRGRCEILYLFADLRSERDSARNQSRQSRSRPHFSGDACMTTRILLVDNKTPALALLVKHFELDRPTWQLFAASNASEANEIVHRQLGTSDPITMALVDYSLTRGDASGTTGIDLIRQLRTLDPRLISILFSARNNVDRSAAFEAGAFDVVEKNIQGAAMQEILLKTERALSFKESEERLNSLSRFFD